MIPERRIADVNDTNEFVFYASSEKIKGTNLECEADSENEREQRRFDSRQRIFE